MKEEMLQSIKKDYENQKELRDNTIKSLEKLKELENNEIVKEYLNLKEKLQLLKYERIINQTDTEIINTLFRRNMYSNKDTNEIYVCLGSFKLDNVYDIEHGPSDFRVRRDDPTAEYRIYKDIENENYIQLAIDKCEKFENTHKVIIPKTILTDKYYYELQKEFILTAVEEGQEKACQKILAKNK